MKKNVIFNWSEDQNQSFESLKQKLTGNNILQFPDFSDLKEYDYKVIYKPGKYNTNADALSRIPLKSNCLAITRSKTNQIYQNPLDEVNSGLDNDSLIIEVTDSNTIKDILNE